MLVLIKQATVSVSVDMYAPTPRPGIFVFLLAVILHMFSTFVTFLCKPQTQNLYYKSLKVVTPVHVLQPQSGSAFLHSARMKSLYAPVVSSG